MRIFISYRRDDSEGFATLIRQKLQKRFGKNAVFQDITGIPPGQKVREYITQQVKLCQVMLVLIDKQWLTITDSDKVRRLDNPGDFVRLEITAGLQNGLTVIPVLLRGTLMPNEAALPDPLKPLPDLNAHFIHSQSLDEDIARLIDWLEPLNVKPPVDSGKILRIGAIGLIVVVLIAGSIILLSGGGGGTQSPTPTVHEPTRNPAYVLAEAGVTRNADWSRYVQDFDGVAMMLVPKGCFQMGSNDGDSNEKPVHQVCFDKPFWIDRTEVTNGQFNQLGGQAAIPSQWTDGNRPRESIAWMESAAFCQKRNARLPTEAEWEYAARGPDNLIYTWGNTFIIDNAVWNTSQTAEVGSKLGGASWVGALDMTGNVWEWVNDWYLDAYYGTLSDGVVNPQGPGTGQFRVLRGGSWYYDRASVLRAAFRLWNPPSNEDGSHGFRCAHSY